MIVLIFDAIQTVNKVNKHMNGKCAKGPKKKTKMKKAKKSD